MNAYEIPFEDFSRLRPWKFNRLPDLESLNRQIAREAIEALKKAMEEGKKLLVICPVGPLDYSYWAELMNAEETDGSFLQTICMDEYLDEYDSWISQSHPLSFRRFMRENLFDRLTGRARVPESNINFPSPKDPAQSTRLIEDHQGADLCYGGMGLTGHLAFNDPPEPQEEIDPESFQNSRTRKLTISRESQSQMCMGGTGGNWDILPKRAVTLGMYELLMSKKIHLTFMRGWHAGVLRRALFGPITPLCPGSFVQNHPQVEVTLTELAAAQPLLHVSQSIGEG